MRFSAAWTWVHVAPAERSRLTSLSAARSLSAVALCSIRRSVAEIRAGATALALAAAASGVSAVALTVITFASGFTVDWTAERRASTVVFGSLDAASASTSVVPVRRLTVARLRASVVASGDWLGVRVLPARIVVDAEYDLGRIERRRQDSHDPGEKSEHEDPRKRAPNRQCSDEYR